jgi:hypothetical protein
MLSTPSVPDKFLHLEHLDICLEVLNETFCPNYDYFSLVHFLDACPMLETFRLDVSHFILNVHLSPTVLRTINLIQVCCSYAGCADTHEA